MNLRTTTLSLFLLAALFTFTPAFSVFAGHPCTGDAARDALVKNGLANPHDCVGGPGGEITTIADLIARMRGVLNTTAPFIIGLAVFVILWGVFGYISRAGEEEKRQEARQFVVWGIIGVFFMLSIWGFVNILDKSFNLNKDAPPRSELPSLPCIPIPPATTC